MARVNTYCDICEDPYDYDDEEGTDGLCSKCDTNGDNTPEAIQFRSGNLVRRMRFFEDYHTDEVAEDAEEDS